MKITFLQIVVFSTLILSLAFSPAVESNHAAIAGEDGILEIGKNFPPDSSNEFREHSIRLAVDDNKLSTVAPYLFGDAAGSLSTSGLVLGSSHKSIEFVHSAFGPGYGSKIYGVDEGNGVTSLIIAARGGSETWTDALYIRAASEDKGGSGRIGILTNDPKEILDVAGSLRVSGRNLDGADLNYLRGSSSMLIGRNRSGWRGETSFITNRGFGALGGFQFKEILNDGTELSLLTVNEKGVGIGTADPLSRLAVDGQIRATEIRVLAQVDVPDYVFEPDYQLQSLEEIEAYIKQNKHLPEIPSAGEIEKDGMALGEMSLRLLKKIEELTLHQVELSKKIKMQNKEMLQMKSQIQELTAGQ